MITDVQPPQCNLPGKLYDTSAGTCVYVDHQPWLGQYNLAECCVQPSQVSYRLPWVPAKFVRFTLSEAMSDSFGSLLPDDFEQFREVVYWDGFFKKRKQKAFEWYGEYDQLRIRLLPLLSGSKHVLMAGCGNSELSAEL